MRVEFYWDKQDDPAWWEDMSMPPREGEIVTFPSGKEGRIAIVRWQFEPEIIARLIVRQP